MRPIHLSNGEILEEVFNNRISKIYFFTGIEAEFFIHFRDGEGFHLSHSLVSEEGERDRETSVKLPDLRKLEVVKRRIGKPDNDNIFHYSDGLKIGHINSSYYYRKNELGALVENSEYLFMEEGHSAILSYERHRGYQMATYRSSFLEK